MIFPTQGSNPGVPHCKQILYQPSYKGSPRKLEWVAYPFSSRFSQPRNQTWLSCNAGIFFTNWAMRKAQYSVFWPRECHGPWDWKESEMTEWLTFRWMRHDFQFRFFILLSLWLLSLGFSKLYWIIVAKVTILILFLILEEMFHLFTAESVSCALMHMVFMLKYVSSILTFRFYHKWLLTFVKGFLCIYWDDNMVFIWFVTVLYHINRWILSHPSIPGINLTWSWYVVLLVNPWVSLLIHWGFYIYVYPCYWPATFLFLRFICLVLPAGWCWPQNEFRNIPSSAVFVECFQKGQY